MDLKSDILRFMRDEDKPVSMTEIVAELGIARSTASRTIHELVSDGEIISSGSKTKVKYYVIKDSDTSCNAIKKLEVDFASQQQERIDELEQKIATLEGKEEKFYAEIISIMGVFVAIFSFILINIDVLQNSVTASMNNCELLMRVLIIDVPLVISIGCILFMIKKFIAFPRRHKNKSEE